MEKAQQRLTEESDILTAMDNRQFALWLQPQVNLRTGEVTSAEALLRMQQPDGTWELPEGMIERIESCGLMVTVGYWVLEESCRQLAAPATTGHHAAAVGESLCATADAPDHGAGDA